MFDNWDWVSFLVGVVATVVLGGGTAFLLGFINLDEF